MFALLWLSLAAFASPPITFDEALRLSLQTGPAVAIADAERRAALEDATADAAWSNPTAGVEHVADETEARVTVPIGLQGIPAAREAKALRSAADVRGDAAQATAALEAGRAWLDARRAEDHAALAAQTLELAKRRKAAAARLVAAQELGTVDAAAIDGDAMRAVADASVAESAAYRTRLSLAAWLGQEPSGALALAAWPVLPLPSAIDASTLPMVVEASDRARAAAAAQARARLQLVPTTSVTAGWRASADGAGVIVGVDVAVPLFAPGLAPSRRAAAASDQADAEARQSALDARARWLAMTYEAESADAAWRAMDPNALRKALTGLAAALDAGELSIAEFTARRDGIAAGLEAEIDAHYRVLVARLELWELAGQLPPEVP